jgi:glycosidase
MPLSRLLIAALALLIPLATDDFKVEPLEPPVVSTVEPPVVSKVEPPVVSKVEPPVVSKVEPPNWFLGHSWNPVRLLVRGRRLRGAQVDATSPGVSIGLVRSNAAGTYVFVDVQVDPNVAKPGPAPLRLATPEGTTTIPFELVAPLPDKGRFQGFAEDDVMYLIMPDRFANGDPSNDDPAAARGLYDRTKPRYYHGGDFRGITERLPYLRDLGVTAIWLNPVYDNTDRLNTRETYEGEAITDYHGFGAVDFYAVEEHFGDLATLRELVDAAHANGLKVIQDQVANHSGPFHPWVTDPPTPTWFNGTGTTHLANRFETHLLMDPRTAASVRRPTLEGWFIDILPDLNQDDEEVARYVIQNSLWWVGMTGLDGIRQDTLPYVPRAFWRRWTAALKRAHPDLRVVGEVMDGSAPFVSFFQGGRAQFDGIDTGIDTLFDYPLYYGIRRAFAQGESIREAVKVLHQDFLYPAPNHLVTLLGSHDVPRFINERGATLEGLKLASTFLLTMRGTPQWYYGDEIAMPGGSDPDNRRDFPGGWRDDPRNAFDSERQTVEERAIFTHVRRLLHIRRDLSALRRGRLVHLAIEPQVYVFARILEPHCVVVALNNGQTPVTLDVDVSGLHLADGDVLSGALGPLPPMRVSGAAVRIRLPARTSEIFARSPQR